MHSSRRRQGCHRCAIASSHCRVEEIEPLRTAAQLALASTDGGHAVSLDEVIVAMRQTAKDSASDTRAALVHVDYSVLRTVSSSYKETSRSGLATAVRGQAGSHGAKISVTVPEC
jgi:hypothetical protein